MAGYDIAALLIHISRLTIRNSLHKAIISALYKGTRRLTHLTDAVCLVHVRVVPVLIHTHIQIHYISFFKRARIGYPMTNALVNRCATTSWKFVVVQWRWISIVRDDVFVNYPVDLFRCHTWLNSSVPCIHCTSGNFTGCTDFDYFVWSIYRYLLVCQRLKTGIRRAGLRVIGLLDVIWYFAVASEGVWERSQWSRELEARFNLLFSFGVHHLVELPQLFETFLRAIVAGLELKLLARGTLHRGWFAAVRVLAHVAGHF
jgi:hypothetical protein